MFNLTRLVALLSMTGILCLSSMGYAIPDNSVKGAHSGGDHEFSGAKPSSPIHYKFSGDENIKSENDQIINQNPEWNEKVIDEKVVLNEQNSHSKPVLANVYLNDHSASSVPEPEIYAMLVAGLSLLGYIARRKKNEA